MEIINPKIFFDMKTEFKILVFLFVMIVSSILCTIPMKQNRLNDKTRNECFDDEVIGQYWIRLETFEGRTWYTLYATNISGRCFALIGTVYFPSSGKTLDIDKNISEYANSKENACAVISLPEKFVAIEDSFYWKECM